MNVKEFEELTGRPPKNDDLSRVTGLGVEIAPLKGYSGKSLGKQVRPYSETQSVWDVLKGAFWPSHK